LSGVLDDVPESHRDLLRSALTATLTTIDGRGRPHSTAVWYLVDEDGQLKGSITSDAGATVSDAYGPRRSLAQDEAAAVMVASDRTCCVCRIPGRPVQLHHIDGDRTNADPANFAVLCLDCHNETQVSGGFGRGLNAAQVRLYRDAWVAAVAERLRGQVRDIGRRAAAGEPVIGAPPERPDDVIDRVLEEAEQSARLALRHMEAVLEREVRGLLASSGWGQGRYDWTPADAIERLHELGVVSQSLHRSFKVFETGVQTVVAGNAPISTEDLLRALDVGAFTYRALTAIPRERHYVVHANLAVYRDDGGRDLVPGVFAVVLRTIGPRPRSPRDQAFLSTKSDYAVGAEVSWRWADQPPRVLGPAWYLDPPTDQYAEVASVDFQGIPLTEIA
jgi:hypothetical protein